MSFSRVPTSAELRETIEARQAAKAANIVRMIECSIGEIDRLEARGIRLGEEIAALERQLAEREMIKAEVRAEVQEVK